jgi:trafficking protein particle complex subunit 10
MDAANTSPSTSKVIIQYTDPDNLLEPFETRFSNWTPLRSLHWKSPTRPLRSIPSLNVSLVRKDPAQNGVQSGIRRHQIPGLRETPYLKLYLLRCDDKESYKESARKDIKQWIKENTLEKESKTTLRNQEHHDAYEWMIVHVVVPGTAAATQPKSSKHISLEATDSTDSVNSKSKWTGKSSSTIYDKLRADFNSSKTSLSRVAQVRLTEQGKPQGALSPSEVEEQWQELVDNLKAAILKSFDTRVSQYEDDIRERENQRSLPGWNFCTFFILKEGLARGFESVGLLEDALAVYSELEVGLDLIIKEVHDQDDVEAGGALLPYSKDLKQTIRKALDDTVPNPDVDSGGNPEPFLLQDVLKSSNSRSGLQIEDSQYRDMILKNQVSALDLRTYMFNRKMDILLRQSRLSAPSSADMKSVQPDLNLVADFAELALEFITLAAREYRSDLYAAWGGRLSGAERATQKIVIGNVVATWTWSAIMHVIARLLPALGKARIDLAETSDTILTQVIKVPLEYDKEKRPVSQDRRSISSAHSSPHRDLRSHSLPRGSVSKNSLDVPDRTVKAPPRPGSDRLLAWIAQLFLLARSVLEELPATMAWYEQLRNFKLAGQQQVGKKLHRLSSYAGSTLVNGPMTETQGQPVTENKLLSLASAVLRRASSSQDAFLELYRLVSACACNLFDAAGSHRASNQVLVELAQQLYSSGNNDVAAEYLGKVLDDRLKDGTASSQPFAVALYAECLAGADQPNSYARCLLACLQSPSALYSVDVAQDYLDRLVKMSKRVDPVAIPLGAILKIRQIDRSISHFEEGDCFQLRMQLHSALRVNVTADSPMKLYMSAASQQDPEQLILDGPTELKLDSESTSFSFVSTVNTQGWYTLDRLEFKVGNLLLVHHFQQEPWGDAGIRSSRYQAPLVMVYPRSDALSIEVIPSTKIVLGQMRTLSLIIRPGNDSVTECSIRLRAASAGLRLNIHESSSTGALDIIRQQDTVLLRLEAVEEGSDARIEIPYTLESASDPSVVVKCEVSYQKQARPIGLYKVCAVDVILPVSVNVQDIHRDLHWFSRFLIRPATLVPIVLRRCSLEDSPGNMVETGRDFDEPLMIYPQHPATWTVRLHQQKTTMKQCLVLNVQYQCLDELILNVLERAFKSFFDQSTYNRLTSYLLTHLLRTVKHGWTEQDLEVAGLMREFEVWKMEDLDWQSALCAFDSETKEGVRGLLEKWHTAASPASISLGEAPVRLLKLTVELPCRPPVINTGLMLTQSATMVAVGQPLACELAFDLSSGDDGNDSEDLEFSYEVFATSEAWLIGGRKKGDFNATGRSAIQQVVLFPQRTGTLLLPMIDVRCRRRDDSKPQSGGSWVDVPIEVHNSTLSKTVQVTANLRSTTIGLVSEEGGQSSSGVMIDSQSHEDG